MKQKEMQHKTRPDQYDFVLALAALFKGVFSIDWIQELSGLRATTVLSVLEEGCSQGVLKKTGVGLFNYVKDELRDSLQDVLPENEKQSLNIKIRRIIMKEPMDRKDTVRTLANHLLGIRNDKEGCRWLVKVGDLSCKSFCYEDALQLYTKALEDLFGLEGDEPDRLFAETALKYSKISLARQHPQKVISILKEGVSCAQRLGDNRQECLLYMNMARSQWIRSKYHSAFRYFEHGRIIANEANDPNLTKSVRNFNVFFLTWQGRFREAVDAYEKGKESIDEYPGSSFALIAALALGYSYAQINQVTQGLGLLDAIRKKSREQGNLYIAANAEILIGSIMVDIRRIDEGFQYLERSQKEAHLHRNDYMDIFGKLAISYTFFLKGDKRRSIRFFREFLKSSSRVEVSDNIFLHYMVKLAWYMNEGKLPNISNISISDIVDRMTKGQNTFLKGVAHRYEALINKQMGLQKEEVIQSFDHALRYLSKAGSQLEFAKTKLEQARYYLLLGEEETAKEVIGDSIKILSPFSEDVVPEDLRCLCRNAHSNEDLLHEILNLGKEVVSIRDNRELVHYILSTVNRLTGAERGAIFLLDQEETPSSFKLRASRNLTRDDINEPGFTSSMKLIKDVVVSGKGAIEADGCDYGNGIRSGGVIRSRICVPMALNDRIVGVLYHDNRLLSSAFRKNDLELLGYFAALATIALNNSEAYEEKQQIANILTEQKQYYVEQYLESFNFGDIVGKSAGIQKVLSLIDEVAGTDTTVLVLGETGVGKELVATAIHQKSHRSERPFIRVNCSALPESLITSELFGHEKGAFTGAMEKRIGRFELAHRGTLFLDEIGDIPLDTQVRLLRVLQNKEFERVGGKTQVQSDFRLVAATNSDLEKKIRVHKFREDLFYRINIFPIVVPPLRERKEDIPLLASFFLRAHAIKLGKSINAIPQKEMEKLVDYDWPGNVRELNNIIERATISSSPPYLRVPELITASEHHKNYGIGITLEENERRHILGIVKKTGGKIRGKGGAAEILGINPNTLDSRMNKLGIKKKGQSLRAL